MDSIGQLFNDLLESVECVGSQLLERGDTRSPLVGTQIPLPARFAEYYGGIRTLYTIKGNKTYNNTDKAV